MSGTRPGPVTGRGKPEARRGTMRDALLRRDGWTRRFVGASPRLEEARALYERLGWEVRFEPPGPEDLPTDCGECPAASSLFQVVYTRGRDQARDTAETESRHRAGRTR